jgi:hypothetical protein
MAGRPSAGTSAPLLPEPKSRRPFRKQPSSHADTWATETPTCSVGYGARGANVTMRSSVGRLLRTAMVSRVVR